MSHLITSHSLSPILLFIPLLITLTFTLETRSSAWLPKIVWTFWDKPIQDDNHLLKALHKNHVDKLQSNGWQIRHLNNDNIWKYLQGIPKINEAKNHKFWEELVIAQRVDLMRLAILGEYGGVYMDMSIILTESLDWLLDMKNNPDIQNKYGQSPNFFYIYATHTYKQHYLDQQTSQQFLIQPAIQVFFLASKPNNKFIQQWYTFAIDTKIQTYHQYKHSDMSSVFIDIAKKQSIDIGGFNQKYFQISVAGIILLARKQRELDAKWAVDREKPRPLVVKEERIWTSDANKNAYRYYSFNMGYFKPFVTVNLNLLKRNQKIPPFFKFWHQVYSQLQTLLKMNITQKCNPNFYILQNSILYQYLLKDYPQKFYNNPIFNQQKLQKQCPPQSQVQRLRLQITNMREEIKKQVMIKIQDTVMLWIKFGLLFVGLVGLVYFKFFYQGSERGRDGGRDRRGKGKNGRNSGRREIQGESFISEDQQVNG